MDRRKRQRVALLAGLLFLILLAEGILLISAGKAARREEERKLGGLISWQPEYEAEYVEVFEDDLGGNEKAGAEVLEKYGYSMTDGRMFRTVGAYVAAMGGVFIFGAAAVTALAIRVVKKEQRESEEKEVLLEELKEAKIRAEKTEEKLRREEQDTKALITDISHQLKTPLAALKMSLELKKSTELTEEEKDELTAREEEETAKLEGLLDSFVHLSRLEADMIRLIPQKDSIKKTLTQSVSSIYMKAFKKNIDISMEEFEDCPIVHDSKWTGEAFVNILDNAVKYSGEDTQITIKVARLYSYIMIEFEDEGMGIPSEETHRIFQRFYRGAQAKLAEEEGSGVGLYLARRILEEQGGTIAVKKGIRGGSNFIVTLPLVGTG